VLENWFHVGHCVFAMYAPESNDKLLAFIECGRGVALGSSAPIRLCLLNYELYKTQLQNMIISQEFVLADIALCDASPTMFINEVLLNNCYFNLL
jgi:hypothetical protein